MRATAVIPAYNEASRIGRVLAAAAGAESVDEVIVVDDGSEDETARVAAEHDGAVVVRWRDNRGKAAAVREGARRARNRVVVFLDADLVGLTPKHVDDLATPVLAGEADMTVGQFRGGNRWLSLWQQLVPSISGQRALEAGHLLAIADLEQTGFGVEVALTRYAARRRLRTRRVYLSDVSHVIKEQKRGVVRGLCGRAVMYGQMLKWLLLDGHRGGAEGAPEE